MNRIVAIVALISSALACRQHPDAMIEWPYVGADQAHAKYSTAEEVTAANVDELEIAWKWEPKENSLEEYGTRPGPFQATPIMVGNVLYLSTMYTRVAALDAETGAEIWTLDPKAYEGGPKGAAPAGFKHRGVAYWSGGVETRIFLNSRDRLYAIDAATGELDTGFGEGGSVLQTGGHGRPVTRYEYDQTSPPVVFEDLAIVGSRVPDRVQRRFDPPATVQAFDVRTGEPVWPIEERAVDTATDVPGEVLYPTQPFPTKPPPFSRQGVSLEDANDLTPEIHALAVEEMQRFRLGPLFTPPSLRGTLQRPGSSGGASWGGAAFDPGTGLLYVRTSEKADTNQLCANAGGDPDIDVEYSNNCPFGATLVMFREPDGLGAVETPESQLGPIPLLKPPYAQLVTIDLNQGDIAWKAPFGEGSRALRQHPLLRGAELPERLGKRGNSGPLATKGGLVFLGGGAPYLYAFDSKTGAEIWRGATPYPTGGNPMTYRTRSGRQFIVIATGAGPDAALVAFARRE